VFVADPDLGDAWEEVATELTEAFDLTREAFVAREPVVYVVSGGDLLGRGGTGRAMVACGLLSGARSAALEGEKGELAVNVLAVDDGITAEVVGRWVARLLEGGGPSGELIWLGGSHLGKALP
jgi:hypothetical protein